MGLFDFHFGSPKNAPQSSSTPEVRSDEPVLPVPNHNTALDIPTRADFTHNVSSGEALGLIGVYRAVQVISTSVMQLSFDAFRDDEAVTPKPLILRRPDADESLSAFIEKTTLSLVLNGNFFWQVFRDNQGRATGLRVLNPHDVRIKSDSFGNVIGYDYQDKTYTKTEIKHGAIMRVPGDPRGRGPIQTAQAELRSSLDARDYSSNWFQDSGVPTGILANKAAYMTAEQAEEAKERWVKTQGGQRGPAVLSGDWTYQPVYLSPEDAQWIEVRQFDTTGIARLFGIPASLMLAAVEGTAMTYQNIGQAWTEFHRFTLIRYVMEIEAAFSDVLPRGTEVKANIEALLRPDSVTRYQQHTSALQGGWMSVNEVRAIEGLEPAPDGDFKTAEQKAQAFKDAQEAPGPGDTTQEEDAPNE